MDAISLILQLQRPPYPGQNPKKSWNLLEYDITTNVRPRVGTLTASTARRQQLQCRIFPDNQEDPENSGIRFIEG